jgi:hypothetical protein
MGQSGEADREGAGLMAMRGAAAAAPAFDTALKVAADATR